MQPLMCLTPFLESGKRFKLPSGETFDQLRQPPPDSSPAADPTATLPTSCDETPQETRVDRRGP